MTKSNKNISYFIIFFAGFSFLIYEVSWNRFLSLLLGTTVKASTIVLVAFMTGFGLGAFFIGKYANKFKNIGRLLGVILGLIGLVSLFNYIVIKNFSQDFYALFSNQTLSDSVFFIVTFIMLTIPAFFMGGIIPIVSKIVISNPKDRASKLGIVYAFETLGSTLGGLFAGFVLLGSVGQNATIFIAVAINLLLALYLIITNKYNTVLFKELEDKEIIYAANSKASGKIALVATLFIGFTILASQITWIRVFKTYFTNTSYTFTLITSFVILGLFIGSRHYAKRGDKIKNNDLSMLKAVVLIIVLSLLSLFFLVKLPELLMFPFERLSVNVYVRLLIIPFIASLLVVLPPAIISGFSFPLACNMYSNSTSDISKNVGRVLMFNTMGSVMGPLLVTFVLIPFFGIGKTMLIIISILSIVAIFIVFSINKSTNLSKYRYVIISLTSVLFLFTLFSKQTQFVPPSVKKYNKKIVSYKETIEGTLLLAEEKRKGVFGKSTFVNNASVIGSNYDAIKVVKMVGHIPFFSGLECKNTLIIGFGIGVTTAAIASHQEVENIDCVELVPGLLQSAHHYKDFNAAVYTDKRLRVIPGDGRHFLQTTNKKYDLISCDPTHPVLGSGNLYTQEYFQEVYDHLNSNGMVSQYLPLHKLRLNDLLGLIKTFHSIFPNSSVWIGQYHAILFGRKDNQKIDFEIWKEKVLAMPKDDFFYFEPYHIASTVFFDAGFISSLPDDIKINTDNLSYTEFFSFDCFDDDNLHKNLDYFLNNKCNISSVFSNIGNPNKMNRFIKGNRKLTKSVYYAIKGEKQKALNQLLEACNVNPEDQEYPFLVKFYYGSRK